VYRSKVKSGLLIFIIIFSGLFVIMQSIINLYEPSYQSIDNIAKNPGKLRIFTYNWSKTYLISTLSTRYAQIPVVTVDKSGNVHIVWQDNSRIFPSDYWEGPSSYYYDIFYKKWNATTGTWEGYVNSTDLVSGISLRDATFPNVVADEKGNVHVVWQDISNLYISNNNPHIFYKYWNSSTNKWKGHLSDYDLVTPNTHTSNCMYPKIAVDKKGNLHFVWQDLNDDLGSGSNYNIFYRCWNATRGGWNPLELISNSSPGISETPCIAVDSKGNVHVAWDDSTDYYGITGVSDYDIFYKFRNATTGVWSGNMNATDLVSAQSTSGSYRPSIAVDKNQNVYVVWYDGSNLYGAGTDYDIYCRYWNATTRVWGGHVRPTDIISYDSGRPSYNPKIVSDDFGNFYIVWQEYWPYYGSTQDQIVFSMWNVSKGVWTAPQIISTETSGDCYAPTIAVDSTGTVHVVWHQYQSSSVYNIYYKKTITTPPAPTKLAPIYPNPNPNIEVELSWQERIAASRYYIYRNTSYISSVTGLTPIAMVPSTSYTDIVNQNGIFYYVIVAGNFIGNSLISNCQSVNMTLIKKLQRIYINNNANFTIYASVGSGSAASPWIIEGYYINGFNKSCISISGTTDYFILRNNTVFGGNRGIILKNVINGKLINNTARLCNVGIQLTGGQSNQLITNRAYNNVGTVIMSGIGFLLNQTTNNWLDKNQAFKNVGNKQYGGIGFLLYISHNNNVSDNIAYNNFNSNSSVTDCGIGFYLVSANNNNLTRNTAYSNGGGSYACGVGFYIISGGGNTVQQSIAYNHTSGEGDGIYLRNTGGSNRILNNTLYKNSASGLEIIGGNTEIVKYNKLFSNGYGTYLWGGGFSVYKNIVWNNSNGIYFVAAYNYIISNNTIYNNTNNGVYCINSNYLKFYNNSVYKNGNGIDLLNAYGCTLIDNSVHDSTGRGFSGYDNFTLYFRNIAYRNDIGFYVGYGSVSSTANTNLTLNLIKDNREGIHLQKAFNTTIKYNRIYNNTANGIYLDKSNVSTIIWNEILDNGNRITQSGSSNNIIQNNAYFKGTILYNIIPNPVIDILINLNWASLPWANYYMIYRRYNAPIKLFWELSKLTPIDNITVNYGVDDQITLLGNYSYVIVAGNSTGWSTISNIQWANVIGYPHPAIPNLDPIVPSINYNGKVKLTWVKAQNASFYYLYRKTSFITSLSGLKPIAKIFQLSYTDNLFVNGTFFYVLVAANLGFNSSSFSNCSKVTVALYSVPKTPILTPLPSENHDGIIHLDWSDTASTTRYYVFRDTSYITNINSLIPIAIVSQSEYTDVIGTNGTYYYCVMAGNPSQNSTLSGCINITVLIFKPPVPSGDYTWIIIIIGIGACVAAGTLMVFRIRSRSRRSQIPSPSLALKGKLKGLELGYGESASIEDKIKALQRSMVPIETLTRLPDAELSNYFKQSLMVIPIQLIEFLQRLDAPLEDKLEIIAEFNNLSEEQKQEYLKELTEL